MLAGLSNQKLPEEVGELCADLVGFAAEVHSRGSEQQLGATNVNLGDGRHINTIIANVQLTTYQREMARDAVSVDSSLWPGASAAGWSIVPKYTPHSHRSWLYISPEGCTHTSSALSLQSLEPGCTGSGQLPDRGAPRSSSRSKRVSKPLCLLDMSPSPKPKPQKLENKNTTADTGKTPAVSQPPDRSKAFAAAVCSARHNISWAHDSEMQQSAALWQVCAC